MIDPFSLYVAYRAKSHHGTPVDGWVTIRGRREPESTWEVEEICKTICDTQDVESVVPQWWRTLWREG